MQSPSLRLNLFVKDSVSVFFPSFQDKGSRVDTQFEVKGIPGEGNLESVKNLGTEGMSSDFIKR